MPNLIVLNDVEELTPIDVMFFVILSIAIIAIVGYLIFYAVTKTFKKYVHRRLKDNSLAEYSSFILDFNNQTFQYFDVKSGAKIKEDKLSLFIDSLEPKEKEPFKDWINNLFNNTYVNGDKKFVKLLNFRITEKDDKKAKYIKHIFLAKKVSKDKQLLYLDISRLENMPLNQLDEKDLMGIYKNYYTTYDNFISTYKRALFANGGIVLVQLNKKFGKDERGYNRAIVESRIVDAVFGSTKGGLNTVFVREVNESISQIYLLTSSTFNLYLLNLIVDRLTTKLKDMFDLSGYFEIFNFKIVASRFNELPKDINESLKLFTDIENIIEEGEKDYIIYQKNSQDSLLTAYSYKGAVEKVFKNNLLSMTYKPIIQVDNGTVSTFGFITHFSVQNNYFNDYEEFKRLTTKAFREQDRLDHECSLVSYVISNTLANKRQKIVYEVDYANLESVLAILSTNTDLKKEKIVITLNNFELVEDENIETYKNNIQAIKKDGYNLGLKLSINESKLEESIYDLFDLFFFDIDGVNVKATDDEFVPIRNILERFVKYKKPLILINCSSWHIIELFIKIGIKHFSSDVISRNNDKLLTIDKRIEKRLLSIE